MLESKKLDSLGSSMKMPAKKSGIENTSKGMQKKRDYLMKALKKVKSSGSSMYSKPSMGA